MEKTGLILICILTFFISYGFPLLMVSGKPILFSISADGITMSYQSKLLRFVQEDVLLDSPQMSQYRHF